MINESTIDKLIKGVKLGFLISYQCEVCSNFKCTNFRVIDQESQIQIGRRGTYLKCHSFYQQFKKSDLKHL